VVTGQLALVEGLTYHVKSSDFRMRLIPKLTTWATSYLPGRMSAAADALNS
jgi:hypothetical protein